jgi:hypothetical protein
MKAERILAAPPAEPATLPTAHAMPFAAALDDPTLLHEWRDLVAVAAEPNAFAEPWFAAASLHLAGSDRARMLVVRDGASLLGLLPICIVRRYGRLPVAHVQNYLHPNSFLGTPLIRAGAEARFWSAVLDCLDAADWSRGLLHMEALVEGGPGPSRPDRRRRRPRPALRLGSSDRARAACQPAQFASLLRNERPQEEAQGVQATGRAPRRDRHGREPPLRAGRRPVRMDRSVPDPGGLRVEGRAGSALAAEPGTAAFFRTALAGAAAEDRLDIRRVDLDGRPIAMLVNFLTPPGAYSFKIAFDEAYGRYSPGVLTEIDNLDILDRPEFDWMDSCAAADHPMIGSLWAGRRAIVRVSVPLGGAGRRLLFTLCRSAESSLHACAHGHRPLPFRRLQMPTEPVFDSAAPRCLCRALSRAARPYRPSSLGPSRPSRSRRLRNSPRGSISAQVEYNRGDLPVGIDPDAVPGNGLDIVETIRSIEQNGSWMVLKFVERDPLYRALLEETLAELRTVVEPVTGTMLKMEAFLFVSSPGSMTPFHFDPEHNILLQLRGTKVMTVFPADDDSIATGPQHETFHLGGHRNLLWDEAFLAKGTPIALAPGQAVHVPVKAPHFVRNGPEVSISFSITWRSEWSYHEASARGLNALLRRAGFTPAPPARYPAQNHAKSIAYRAVDKLRRTLRG